MTLVGGGTMSQFIPHDHGRERPDEVEEDDGGAFMDGFSRSDAQGGATTFEAREFPDALLSFLWCLVRKNDLLLPPSAAHPTPATKPASCDGAGRCRAN